MIPLEFQVALPRWMGDFLNAAGEPGATVEQRMELVLELAQCQVERATGGPFAAAVFDLDRRRLVAVGVNLVVPSRLSTAHAEVVALSLAQQQLGTHDLSVAAGGRLELVASAEPCCMCFGAIHWSGIPALVCAARDADVRNVGFDEGPKPEDWAEYLRRRGTTVRRDVLRSRAADVLRRYQARGGTVYNAGSGQAPPDRDP